MSPRGFIRALWASQHRVSAPEIARVVIDDDSFEAVGARQPLPRNYLADLADFLLLSGARVVAFDVTLKRASVPAEDAALVRTARRWETAGKGRLVFATIATPETGGSRLADGNNFLSGSDPHEAVPVNPRNVPSALGNPIAVGQTH